MKRQKTMFNFLLRKFRKYKAKLARFELTNRNQHRQGVLRKHIARIEKKLYSLLGSIKKAGAVAAVSAALALSPTGADAQQIQFASPVGNPFGLSTTYNRSTPDLVDLDGDGDLDLMSGGTAGFYYFENTAGAGNTPTFLPYVLNPFGLVDIGYRSNTDLIDLDGDGDLDLMSGEYYGAFYYFENTAGAGNTPAFAAPVTNPFGLTTIPGYWSSGSNSDLIDLDGDGDLDLVSGSYYGDFYYFVNTAGAGNTPAFAAPVLNPFGLVPYTSGSFPNIADLDGDGDLDLISSFNYNTTFAYYENTAGAGNTPAFAGSVSNPFGLIGVGGGAPDLVDLDGDGDLDLMSGQSNGQFQYFENITLTPVDWTGASSTDWNTPSNWNPAGVPSASDFVIIPDVSGASGNFPDLTVAISVADLRIDAGAALSVSPGVVLTILPGRTITNNGILTLEADATSTGMLDDFTNFGTNYIGNITVQQFVSPGSGLGQRMFGSPVNNGVVSGLDQTYASGSTGQIAMSNCATAIVDVGSPYNNLFEWHEDANSPNNCSYEAWFARAQATPLENGRGYSGWMQDGSVFSFTGSPNTGNVNYGGALGDLGSGLTNKDGWHVLSNPYPSSINANSLTLAGGGVPNILFVSDNLNTTEIPGVLTTAGYTVTTVLNDYVSGDNTVLQGNLSAYDLIYWHAVGSSGFGQTHNIATMTNLSSFVSGGGSVFVTGYDVITSPTDPNLISFLGGSGSQDGGFNGTGTVTSNANSLTTGVTNITNLAISVPGDHDGLNGLQPGTISVAESGNGQHGWTLRTLGAGEIAWVSSSNLGTDPFPAWSTPGSGWNEALLNFAFNTTGANLIPWNSLQTYDPGQAFGGTFQPILPGQDLGVGQGFVAFTTGNGNTARFKNDMRNTNSTNFKSNTNWFESKLDIEVSGNGFKDVSYIYFSNDATAAFDNQWDCKKKESDAGQPTLYTEIASEQASLNGLSTSELGNESIPLGLAPGANGIFTFEATGLSTFPASTIIYLEDKATGTWTNLREQATYSFNMTEAEAEDRFEIHFTKPIALSYEAETCAGHDGSIMVDFGNQSIAGNLQSWDYELSLAGQFIAGSSETDLLELMDLVSGDYELVFTNGNLQVTEYITIEDKVQVEAEFTTNSSTLFANEVLTATNSSLGATAYTWEVNGETFNSVDLTYTFTTPGNYVVRLFASNNDCDAVYETTVIVNEKTTGIAEQVELNNALIFASGKTITVDLSNVELDGKTDLEIYTMVGQLMVQKLNVSDFEYVDMNQATSGIYIVKIINQTESISKKVILK